jgi:hypothetical protein
VVFPPENWNPDERKLPRTLRHHSRVKCSEPVRIRSAEDSSNHFDDVCITQNISRDGLYFTSEHSAYREGMRLVINFLYHLAFSAPHTDYLGQVVRVDESKDGGVGVAVKLSEPIAWQKAHDHPGRVVVFRQKKVHQRIVKAVPETTAVAAVPGAKVRGQLKEAISLRRVQQIASDICRRARRRSALGAEWANELGRIFYSHARKLLRLKWLSNYLRSNRSRSEDKRSEFFSTVWAGLVFEIAAARARMRLGLWDFPEDFAAKAATGFMERIKTERRR